MQTSQPSITNVQEAEGTYGQPQSLPAFNFSRPTSFA
jgi:hypothetical protein